MRRTKVYVVITIDENLVDSEIVSVDVNRVFDTIEKAKAYIFDKLLEYDENWVGAYRSCGKFVDSYNRTSYVIREIEVL